MTKLLSIRLVAILVGLGFAVVALYSFVVGAYAAITEEAPAHLPYEEPRDIAYSFDGPFGKWDVQQLQRGFKVYNEVCSACHSLKFVAFRDLEQIGYDEGQVKAFRRSDHASWPAYGLLPVALSQQCRSGCSQQQCHSA